jgi:hypothetical protein
MKTKDFTMKLSPHRGKKNPIPKWNRGIPYALNQPGSGLGKSLQP